MRERIKGRLENYSDRKRQERRNTKKRERKEEKR